MQLVAKNGPLAGTAVPLVDGLTLRGPDTGVESGKPCCRIRAANGGFVVQALDRQGPLFVNGLPLTTRALEVHDELRLGDTLFVVQSVETPAAPSLAACEVRLDASRTPQPIHEVGFEDSVLCRPARSTTREGADLDALLRLGAALSSVRGLAALDAALAALVLEASPLERVVLTGDADGPAGVRSAWSATATPDPITIDPNLVDRVVKTHVASMVRLDGGRSAIVLPMIAFGRATGALWGETPADVTLDAAHIRLLLVMGALAAVTRALDGEAARLQEANELLQAEINIEHNMVGRSRPMRALFDRIARVARGDATILLRGESGTGKELVARAIHRNSPRANRPFVAINCAAITETLLESELFGHEKGAFTGALGLKKGKLELADGGTLFLDEVGELPLALQAKLLRALQEREFERVGGTRPVRVDFRLVAATNRDLETAIKAGTFRQDLYYRLKVVDLSLPPLRDRKEDIRLLAEYFVRKHAQRCGRRVAGFTTDALARLAKHDWPGNVRELENVIEQALALGTHDCIVAEDLPIGLGCASGGSGSFNYHETLEQARRDLIVRAFERAGHSHTAAARLLGVHPNYLHRLLSNLNLRDRIGERSSA